MFRPRFTPRVVLLIAALGALAGILAACGGSDDDRFVKSTPAGSTGGLASNCGLTMLVARERQLLLRDVNGEEKTLVASPANTFPSFPAWSPDGTRIAYAQTTNFTSPTTDWGTDLYVADADGGNAQLVWKHDAPGAQIQGITWSPDGRSLLFGYWLTLIKDGKYAGQVQRMQRIDASANASPTPTIDGALYPSITRDGSRVAYMTQKETGEGAIWVAAPDGGNARELVVLGSEYQMIIFPRISPDGSAVVFAAVATKSSGVPKSSGGATAKHGLPMDVFAVSVADGKVTRLTTINEDEPYPVWSRDGKCIATMATGGLYEMNADGSNLRKIGPGTFGGHVDVK